MLNNYKIVLFRNKERYKILKQYQTLKNAEKFYRKKVEESNLVMFDIQFENGSKVEYEIALVSKNDESFKQLYVTDELGRNLPVELNDDSFYIKRLEKYKFEEYIYHIDKKEKINFDKFINKLEGKNLKLISKINNKIILQEDNKVNLFSLKNVFDADRFLTSVQSKVLEMSLKNSIIVRDTSIQQKKYLYDFLFGLGYNKKMLYRVTTTHSKDK